MLVIGGSTSVGIVLGIIRYKVLAVLLGASGVGVMGLYESIHQTGQQIAGLGMDQSGVRRVAASQGDPEELSRVRRALIIAGLLQGAIGMAVLWLMRERISLWLFNSPDHGFAVGVLGIGILLSLIAAARMALLQGMRRIDDLAKSGIAAAVLTTIGGIAAVWMFGSAGLLLIILAQPAFLMLIAGRYVARLPRMATSMGIAGLWRQWRSMVGLGLTLMFAGLVATSGVLIARALIVDSQGLESAGHFQAAWSISMQFVGLVLVAMGTDYFPRLSAIISDRDASTSLVNDQAQIGLALGAPGLLAVLGLAPWIVPLLYSGAFEPAIGLLQWLCVGNILRLASWPTGFIMIAREDRWTFAVLQALWQTVFLAVMWMTMPDLGVDAVGIAFVSASLFGLLANNLVVHRLHGFRWQRLSLRLFAGHLGLLAALLVLAKSAPIAGAVAGVVASAATGMWGLRLVAIKMGPEGKLGLVAMRVFRFLNWPLPDMSIAGRSVQPGAGE